MVLFPGVVSSGSIMGTGLVFLTFMAAVAYTMRRFLGEEKEEHYGKTLIAYFSSLLIWALLTSLLAARNFYAETTGFFTMDFATLAPFVITAAFLIHGDMRRKITRWFMSIPLRHLTWVHIIRIAAIGTIVKLWNGSLPAHFILPVGIPDFIFALSVPVMDRRVFQNRSIGNKGLIAWNAFGAILFIPSMVLLYRIDFVEGGVHMRTSEGEKQITVPAKPSWLEEGEVGYVRTRRLDLRYIKAGSGKPLVLIHTIRTHLDYFHRIIPKLSRHFEVYALDLPGHGYSSIPRFDYTEGFFTNAVLGFLEQLDIRHATVVGESIGGVIALSLAGKGNKRIERVISLNPYDYGEGGGIRRSSTLANIIFTAMAWPVVGWIVSRSENRLILRKILEGGFVDPKALPGFLLDDFNRVGFRSGYRRAERMIFLNWESWTAARESYDSISLPVLLVYGEHDWSRENEREANHALIPGSRMIVLTDTGHFSSLEKPEEIIRIILEECSEDRENGAGEQIA
jgi:pimeloyl-ACP methyl ester carboxylesterase